MSCRSLYAKCLLAAAIVALCVANLNADVLFTDTFDEYSPPVAGTPLGAPWTQQGGGTVLVKVWDTGSQSLPNLIGYDAVASEAMISRPTGAATTDANVVLSACFNGEVSASTLSLVLGPHAAPGSDRWRAADSVGSLALFWNCTSGVTLNYVGDDGVADVYNTGLVSQTGKVNFRFVAPKAAGAQTIAVDWKLASDSSWTNLANVSVESGFSADYIGIRLAKRGASWADDVHFQSATPEPSTCILMLTCIVSLLAYAWRRRK
jgi:hypothetical protein